MLSRVVRKLLEISSEGSDVNLASETSDEIYSALLDLSCNPITPQGMAKNVRLASETSDESYSATSDLACILNIPQGMTTGIIKRLR